MIKMEDMDYTPDGVLARALRPRGGAPFPFATPIFLVQTGLARLFRTFLKFSLHPPPGPDKPTDNEACDDVFIT
jgi:hypothetical protein